MAFTKYQSVEQTEVVSPEEHTKISKKLKKEGKSSVSELSSEKREELSEELDS